MQNRSGIFILVVWALAGSAQEAKLRSSEVPPTVNAAAEKQFAGARLSAWSKEVENGKTTYEVSVVSGSSKKDAVFNPDGSLAAIEEVVAVSALPVQVRDAVSARYPGSTLRKAEKITSGDQVQYEVALAKAAKKEVLLSAEGKIVKEQ